MGYERGTSISKAWELATTDGAVEVASYVVAHLAELSGVPDDATDRGPRLREFCRKFAERAFRRPLTDEQKRLYIDRPFESVSDLVMAVKRFVLLVLKSPRFLYREVGGSQDAYDVAARLSFGLWDSLPDEELLKAAASGKLATREQVLAQAERMVSDLRAAPSSTSSSCNGCGSTGRRNYPRIRLASPVLTGPPLQTCARRWSCSWMRCSGARIPITANFCSRIMCT